MSEKKNEFSKEINENRGTKNKVQYKKTLGFMFLSTGIVYCAIFILYWAHLIITVHFLISLLERNQYFYLAYIIDAIIALFTLIGASNILYGSLLLREREFSGKKLKYFKITLRLSLILFPLGTISGIIGLKEFDLFGDGLINTNP